MEIESMTSRMQSGRSTTELIPPKLAFQNVMNKSSCLLLHQCAVGYLLIITYLYIYFYTNTLLVWISTTSLWNDAFNTHIRIINTSIPVNIPIILDSNVSFMLFSYNN